LGGKEKSDNLVLLKRYRELVSKIEKLLEEHFSPDTGSGDEIDFPVDVFIETASKELVIEIEMAGLNPGSVNITGTDNVLEIWGKKDTIRDDCYESCIYLERENGPFRKLIHIEHPVDYAKAQASFKAGVLIIRLPLINERRGIKNLKIKNEE
jgi:HSP20 family molecular chaperone IbpA